MIQTRFIVFAAATLIGGNAIAAGYDQPPKNILDVLHTLSQEAFEAHVKVEVA